jgi:hypothetical protein
MSLTVQQLIADAKKLSTRLMDRDQSADRLISRGQDVLKEVEAMRQYQENIENLNEIAHQRPRAHLVLGIQQENRHIRSLQQENKELRATLEEHQAALELIMSKYREHISRMIKSTGKIEYNPDNLAKQLHEKTMKVYEMAAVMKEAVKRDEEKDDQERELIARLYTENKGLRELLEISQRGKPMGAARKSLAGKREAGVQTEEQPGRNMGDQVDLEVTLPMPAPPPRLNRSPAGAGGQDKTGQGQSIPLEEHKKMPNDDVAPMSPVDTSSTSDTSSLSASESDETSDDDSVKYDTIKLRRKNPPAAVTPPQTAGTLPPAAVTPPQTAGTPPHTAVAPPQTADTPPHTDNKNAAIGSIPKEVDKTVVVDGSLANSLAESSKGPDASPKSGNSGSSPITVSLEHHMNAINNNTSPQAQAQAQQTKTTLKEKTPPKSSSPQAKQPPAKTPPVVKQPANKSPSSARQTAAKTPTKQPGKVSKSENRTDRATPPRNKKSAKSLPKEKVNSPPTTLQLQQQGETSPKPEKSCDPTTSNELNTSNQKQERHKYITYN